MIEELVHNRSDYLGLDEEAFNSLENKEQFGENLLKCEFKSLDDFVEKFAVGLTLTGFVGAEEENAQLLTDELIKTLELSETKAVKAYEENDDIKAKVNAQMMKDAKTLNADNFKTLFNTVVILAELNENDNLASAYENVLKDYKEEIGLDFSAFNSLKNQTSVINKMMSKTSDFNSLDDIKEKFELFVVDAKNQSSGKGSSGGGGGGGGGGSVTRTPVATQESAKTETVNKVVFNDLSGAAWATEAINYLAERNIVNGRAEGVFAPLEFVTRAEAVKLIVTAFALTSETSEAVFDDVKNNAWYYSYVMTAYQNGIVNGIDDKNFAPDAPVTRQDFAVMISRLVENNENTAQLTFDDASQISEYAKNAVALLVKRGVVNGNANNCFEPLKNTTRAESAKILFEMIKTGV